MDDILKDIAGFAKFTLVTSEVYVCKDEMDNFLLALAKDGKATHLLTGDKDLLEMKKFGRTAILTMTEFLNAV